MIAGFHSQEADPLNYRQRLSVGTGVGSTRSPRDWSCVDMSLSLSRNASQRTRCCATVAVLGTAFAGCWSIAATALAADAPAPPAALPADNPFSAPSPLP